VSAVAQGLNPATRTITVAPGPNTVPDITLTAAPSNGVRADLAAIATALAAMPNSAQARHALKSLQKLNDAKLWLTNDTLTPRGKKVFDRIAETAGRLSGKGKGGKGGKGGSGNPTAAAATNPQLAAFLPRLGNDALQLATTQISLSTAAGGDPKELAKAGQEKLKGLAFMTSGDYKKAIEHFSHAWEHAEHALKKKGGKGGGGAGAAPLPKKPQGVPATHGHGQHLADSLGGVLSQPCVAG
jgi:hypothetical protein